MYHFKKAKKKKGQGKSLITSSIFCFLLAGRLVGGITSLEEKGSDRESEGMGLV